MSLRHCSRLSSDLCHRSTLAARILDGASELLVQVFGERGTHARSAVSVAQVPFGACVEIDMIAELRATQVGESI